MIAHPWPAHRLRTGDARAAAPVARVDAEMTDPMADVRDLWRQRADEARALAETIDNPAIKQWMLRTADRYALFAQQAVGQTPQAPVQNEKANSKWGRPKAKGQ